MKKTIAIAVLAAFISLGASAQEAFRHLGLGLEVGTTGAGVELSLPIVTNHFTLKAGYTFIPKINFNDTESFDLSEVQQMVDDANVELAKLKAQGINESLHTVVPSNGNLDMDANAKMGNAKVLLEYYPSKKSSFHFIAGAYFGGQEIINAAMTLDQTTWAAYNSLKEEVTDLNAKYAGKYSYSSVDIPDLKYNLNGNTYEIQDKGGKGYTDASLSMNSFKPYFGLGIGRSVPKRRVSVQFELGAWYMGDMTIDGSTKTAFDSSIDDVLEGSEDIIDTVTSFGFYPEMRLALTFRLF